VSALGTDPFSTELLSAWQAEGLDTRLVARLPDYLPGLYIIRTDDQGERTFYYWRQQAAARELFRCTETERIEQALLDYDFVYLSGISLAILDETGRERLLALLERIRANGGKVGFDSNYRPRLWADKASAQHWLRQVWQRTDIACPTFEDEAALWGDADPSATAARLQALGVAEIVVKQGAQPSLVLTEGQSHWVASDTVVKPIDTTAAGDSFNAAYCSARLMNQSAVEAVRAGHRLAARVIQQPGAIIPRDPTSHPSGSPAQAIE
jgi:2-dehydro-3-deoxygluconokinase